MGIAPEMAKSDEALSYAALILADADMDVTAENLTKITSAAGVSAPAYMAALFEKVNSMNSVQDMVKKAGEVGSGGGGGGGGAPAAGGAAAAAPVEEEEEEEEIPAAGGLFDDGDDY